MGCAVGACLGCVVIGVDGPQRVCREGPVFAADEIAWDEAREAAPAGGRPPAAAPSNRTRHPRRRAALGAGPRPETRAARPAASRRRLGAPAGDGPPCPSTTVDLTVDLAPARPGGLLLRNPILVRRGTFGYGIEYGEVVDVQRLGAICCKGTTLKARAGNPPPRVTETPAGMLNSIGLQNPGVDAVIDKYAALWATWQVPVIVNVAGESIEDYVEVVRRLDGVPGVAGIELNISCPNVGKGGLQFAIDRDAAGAVTAAVRRATDLPLMVKLSPNVADVRPIAQAIEEAGADAISAINTLSGMAIDRAAAGRSWATRTAASPARRSSPSRCGSCTRWPRSCASRSWRSAASPRSTTCSTSCRRRGRRAGRHGHLRRPRAAGPPRRRAGGLVRGPGAGQLSAAHRHGPAGRGAARASTARTGRASRAWSTGRDVGRRDGPRGSRARSCSGPPARSGRATSSSRAAGTARATWRSSRSCRTRPRPASCAACSPRPSPTPRAARRSTSSPARPPAASSWPSRRPASSACPASSPRRCETAHGATRREFRRGFRLLPGQRVLLVDDILTTGGSLLAMLPPIEAAGAELAGAVVLVDRAGGTTSVTSTGQRPLVSGDRALGP